MARVCEGRRGWGGVTYHPALAVLQSGAVQTCHSGPKLHLAREDRGLPRKAGDTSAGAVQGDGVESAALPSALHCARRSPFSWHHPEHEHFFNHSRESRAEPSGGRVSHCSVCSHHPARTHRHTAPTSPPPPHTHTHPTLPCLQLCTYHHLPLLPPYSAHPQTL